MVANQKQKKITTILLALLLFFTIFLLFTSLVSKEYFATDEGDIFLAGRDIVKGKVLYKDLPSQHMPVMYYLAAAFYAVGAHSTLAMRLCFYCLFSGIWALMYIRYAKIIGAHAVAFYPIFYLAAIATIEHGHCILSEQLQGIGMVILLWELIRFFRFRDISWISAAWISFAIFVSFGSAFVSVFAIATVVLGVFLIEIIDSVRSRVPFNISILSFWKKFWKVILLVTLPFLAMIAYYFFTGIWGDFYFNAYEINRSIYPKYQSFQTTGQYGGNILTSLLTCVDLFGQTLLNLGAQAGQNLTYFIIQGGLLGGVIWFLISIFQRHGMTCGIVMTSFILQCATRGIFEFHGLPFISVACAIIGICAEREIVKFHKKNYATYKLLLFLCVTILFFSPFLSNFSSITTAVEQAKQEMNLSEDPTKWKMKDLVRKIAEPDERIYAADGELDLSFDWQFATKTTHGVPWYWDVYGKEVMEELQSEPPRIIVSSLNHQIWGHNALDYASEFFVWLQKNYTQIDEEGIWVRNDAARQAQKILYDGVINYQIVDHLQYPIDMRAPGKTVIQRVKGNGRQLTYLLLRACSDATTVSSSSLQVTLLNEEEKILFSQMISGSVTTPTEYVSLAATEANITLQEGETYTIVCTVPTGSTGNINLFCNGILADPNRSGADGNVVVAEEAMPYTLDVLLYTKG